MEFQRTKINQAVVAALASTIAAQSYGEDAQRNRAIEEIVVTATKREVPLQDVAVAVQALTESTLNDLGIDTFEDPGAVHRPLHAGQSVTHELKHLEISRTNLFGDLRTPLVAISALASVSYTHLTLPTILRV